MPQLNPVVIDTLDEEVVCHIIWRKKGSSHSWSYWMRLGSLYEGAGILDALRAANPDTEWRIRRDTLTQELLDV